MQVAARAGIAAAAAGITGIGVYKLYDFGADRTRRNHAELDQQVAAQTVAWDAWKGQLDTEFPSLQLDTPADHARFARFLEDHPEPSWVSVEHQGVTRVRLGLDEQVVDDKHFPVERGKVIGYAGIGALGIGACGGALLRSGLRSSGSVPQAAAGAAALAFGVAGLAGVVSSVRTGTNLEGHDAFVDRVRAEMQ